jgi:hypothetical protein
MTDEQFTILVEKIDTLSGDFREHKGRTEIEIKNLVKQVDSAGMWENIKVIGIMPVMAAIHHIWGGK